jgi:hypothetical protein
MNSKGTGKSFLIETISHYILNKYGKQTSSNDCIVALLAPTGLAAFNINGLTLHKFFKLPVQKSKNSSISNIKFSSSEIKIMKDLLKKC